MTATVSASVASSWINGAAVVTGGANIRSSTRRTATSSPSSRWPPLPTSTPRSRQLARHSGAGRRATPVDRATVLAKLAALMSEHADELVAEEVSQTGKPVRLATRVRRPRQHRQHRFLRRRGPSPRGQGHRRVLRRPHLEHPARGGRRRRDHHAVELPAADGGVEGAARVGRRMQRRHQARRADAADHADAGAAGHRGGPAGRRLQRRSPARAATSAPRWPAIRTSTW